MLRILVALLFAGLLVSSAGAYDFKTPFEILDAQADCENPTYRKVDFEQTIVGCGKVLEYYSNPEADRADEYDRLWELSKAYYYRAAAYHRHGDLDHALSDFASSISLDASNRDSLNGRAFVHLDRGEYAEAKADIDASLKLTNFQREGYWLLGVYFEKIGDKAKAIEAYESALQRDPDYKLAHERLRALESK